MSESRAAAVRVGCDVQSSEDVRAAIASSGDRYLHRLLGEAERGEAAAVTGSELLVRYVTGRFAAKEAVYKVLRGRPDLPLPLSQIQIIADEVGAPQVRLSGAAAQLAVDAGIGEISVSISHAEPFAFAVAAATLSA